MVFIVKIDYRIYEKIFDNGNEKVECWMVREIEKFMYKKLKL